MIKKDKDTVYNICFLYLEGIGVSEIARILKIDRHTPTEILKKHGIYKEPYKVKVDTSYDNKIIELYDKGYSKEKISNILNIGVKKIHNCLIRNDIKIREYHQYKKHIVNENIFNKIDTEEKAYWLGFLYADGYVSTKRTSFRLELALKASDKKHLEKFKNFMQTDNQLIYNKKTNSYKIKIHSKKIVNDLINLGCIENKSLILKFPTEKQVPKHLVHHFMRGYFDGDGCISIVSGQKRFEIAGAKAFLDIYEKILLEGINKQQPNKRLMHKNIQTIKYAGNKQVKKIYGFLYNNATVYLDRKYEKFNNTQMPSQDKADKKS